MRLVTRAIASLLAFACLSQGTVSGAAAASPGSAPAGIDLAKQYPATLDWAEDAPARTWKSEAKDVWSLMRWSTRLVAGEQKLTIELGSSDVVFGHHEGNVVWAAVLPEKPGRLTTDLPGGGDEVTSVWLRFYPALVGTFFPADSVKKQGLESALAAFDDVYDAFDREYAKFALHPGYDFAKAGAALRKRAAAAKTCYEVGVLLAELLRPLDDLHIDVSVDGEWIQVATRDRPQNGSWDAVRAQLVDLVDTKQDCFYGRTRDDVGYVNVYQLGDKELPKRFDEALEKLGHTWAMIVDLRFNGGGDELLAREIAGRFVDRERVYSVNRYRSGSRRDQHGPWLERKFSPRGPWRYESPVILLQGQRTMSSAESMALMFAQCPQVTTMGDKTAGSSGNPRFVETKGKIKVRLPRWDDRDPQQNPIEGKGIPPGVQVAAKQEQFTPTSDPVLSKALETLRAIPEDERVAGKRSGGE